MAEQSTQSITLAELETPSPSQPPMHWKSCRKIRRDSLIFAEICQVGPFGAKAPRRKGAKARGLTFERKIGKKLLSAPKAWGGLRAGTWIRFEDCGGPGWAQPDFFFLGESRIVLLEAKLTETPAGWEQLWGLYAPLLMEIFPSREIICVQVCQNLARGRGFDAPVVVTELSEIIDGCIWHQPQV